MTTRTLAAVLALVAVGAVLVGPALAHASTPQSGPSTSAPWGGSPVMGPGMGFGGFGSGYGGPMMDGRFGGSGGYGMGGYGPMMGGYGVYGAGGYGPMMDGYGQYGPCAMWDGDEATPGEWNETAGPWAPHAYYWNDTAQHPYWNATGQYPWNGSAPYAWWSEDAPAGAWNESDAPPRFGGSGPGWGPGMGWGPGTGPGGRWSC